MPLGRPRFSVLIALFACAVTGGGALFASGFAARAVSAAGSSDNLTFHHDTMRSGWYQNETVLTASNVNAGSFGQLATFAVSGKVYAQPLYVTNETVANGTKHNLVIVASATDQLYAFDDATGAVVWKRSFTNPPSVRQQLWNDFTANGQPASCSDVNPDIGITGTPVADRALDRLFVVVPTKDGSAFHMRLHAVSLKNGTDAVPAVEVTAVSGTQKVDPLLNFQRSALLESGGNVYVALAGHCDMQTSITHGWVLSYNTSTLKQTGNLLNTTKTAPSQYYLGSPWMAGFGPAADAQGNVYFATGNGAFDGKTSFSMSVLKVPASLDLAKVSFFTPASWQQDNQADADLGSGGVMLLPDQTGANPHLLIQGGKCSAPGPCFKYILDRDKLGGVQASSSKAAPALWQQDTAGQMWGGPAYFKDASGAQYVLYGGGLSADSGAPANQQTPLSTYQLNTAPVGLTMLKTATYANACLECRSGGSQPVVSSNGTAAGSAVVWVVQTPNGGGGAMALYAFDPATMSTLFTAPAGVWKKAVTTPPVKPPVWQGGAMVSPLVANGKVYVPAQDTVMVFGLKATTAHYVAQPHLQGVPSRPAPAVAPAPHALVGTINAIAGTQITVHPRSGADVHVDASAAIKNGQYSAPLFVGKIVVVQGTRGANGVFVATSIQRLDSLQAAGSDY